MVSILSHLQACCRYRSLVSASTSSPGAFHRLKISTSIGPAYPAASAASPMRRTSISPHNGAAQEEVGLRREPVVRVEGEDAPRGVRDLRV